MHQKFEIGHSNQRLISAHHSLRDIMLAIIALFLPLFHALLSAHRHNSKPSL